MQSATAAVSITRQGLFDDFIKGDLFKSNGIIVFGGIFVVDAVDLGGFVECVSSDLGGSQGGGGVGGEKGASRAPVRTVTVPWLSRSTQCRDESPSQYHR